MLSWCLYLSAIIRVCAALYVVTHCQFLGKTHQDMKYLTKQFHHTTYAWTLCKNRVCMIVSLWWHYHIHMPMGDLTPMWTHGKFSLNFKASFKTYCMPHCVNNSKIRQDQENNILEIFEWEQRSAIHPYMLFNLNWIYTVLIRTQMSQSC